MSAPAAPPHPLHPIRWPLAEPDPMPVDPVVQLLVDTLRDQAAAQDKRQADLVASFEARDEKRDERHDEIVKAVGALALEVRANTVEMSKVAKAVPGRAELWALGSVICLLLLVFVGLYAQANGHDAGDAIDDARRGLDPIVTAKKEDDP